MSDDKRNKKKAPIICAVVVIALLGLYLGAILLPLIGEVGGTLFAIGFLLVYGGCVVAVIAGVIAALRQRLQEIEDGEEEEAKKY